MKCYLFKGKGEEKEEKKEEKEEKKEEKEEKKEEKTYISQLPINRSMAALLV